jgi:hypothetical protein
MDELFSRSPVSVESKENRIKKDKMKIHRKKQGREN